HNLIHDIIPSATYNKGVIDFVDSFLKGSKIGLLSFGLLLSLFFASSGMMGIVRSFNKFYLGFQPRKGFHSRMVAIRLTFVLFGLLLAYIVLLILQGSLLNLIVKNEDIKNVIFYSRWLFIIALVLLAIASIFRYAPAVKKKWKFLSPGVIFSTVLCLIATLGFSYFVSKFGRYNALYGSIGTIMMVMGLIFINSLALLIGFELNVSIKSLQHIAAQRTEEEKNT
ncbi:MAG: YihY/virulence factor BrkB family protein, partial [Ferruginibacter sp.]